VPELGRHARSGLNRPGRLAVDAAGRAAGGLFAAVATVRRAKSLHPRGAAYDARLVVDGARDAPRASTLLSTPAERPAIIRVSRSVGLPAWLPDLLGLAVRVPDAYGHGRHQDFLLVTSIDRPVLHHIFVPVRDAQARVYSSSLPYRAGDERLLIGAVPDAASPRPAGGGDELERLDRARAAGDVRFGLAVAPIGGRFRRVGTLHVGARLPDDADGIRFNPFNTGGGLEPTGAFNRLRDYAYPMSQRAWTRAAG
jgi:hypothetical protein